PSAHATRKSAGAARRCPVSRGRSSSPTAGSSATRSRGWTATATISACRGGATRSPGTDLSVAGRLDRLEVEGRRQEGLRVRMGGLREDPLTWPVLDDAAGPHDEDLVAERSDHAEVVADEHIGQPMARLELAQQVDELCDGQPLPHDLPDRQAR